ncbi:ferredoxin (2Fe-2S) [Thalassoporum mexicanum PCC 7367]|uniref:2Fe-2S iron-sulfur cluster-binding protein n=1 Tax=Thalassoporum mexicanum TaxID=3457544 RepID=UPI00029F8652|nr:2Fe-2S iron-sulfur cluster-binding protein [Pseudanabaena sp. PCC 7367]AFY70700.1 ferredoxin (2Fe-2S) [Pseudanabaena sp. PCC 7367]
MTKEPPIYTVRVHDRRTGEIQTARVRGDRYILDQCEEQGIDLPAACCNGTCTTCAMRVKSGQIDQSETVGLSPETKQRGYALICVGYACSDLELETQDEDEVYMLQFGRFFEQKQRIVFGIPIDHD